MEISYFTHPQQQQHREQQLNQSLKILLSAAAAAAAHMEIQASVSVGPGAQSYYPHRSELSRKKRAASWREVALTRPPETPFYLIYN